MLSLVCEGGAMRGAFTAGALDALTEMRGLFGCVYGVSAGAGNAISFVSGQKGRNYKVFETYGSDPRYISVKNMFRLKPIMDFRFIFEEIPNRLIPFDYDAFFASPLDMKIGLTSVERGEAVFFPKSALDAHNDLIKASCSVPVLFKPVMFSGALYYDGGIGSPIPIDAAMSDGYEKHVVILTRPIGTRKKITAQDTRVYKALKKNHPIFAEAFLGRTSRYNTQIALCEKLALERGAVVLAPKDVSGYRSYESAFSKVKALYDEGYAAAAAALGAIEKL